jgi:hypothetical protein
MEESMAENLPTGQERDVKLLGGATIDGAPITYIIVLAAVVVALSFIPISVILITGGGSFPMSQGVLGLVGWILGPVAGGISSGIGALIAIFLAPQTAGLIPGLRILSSVISTFAAGSMGIIPSSEKNYSSFTITWIKIRFFHIVKFPVPIIIPPRKYFWLIIWVIGFISFLIYLGRAIYNGVGLWVFLAASFVDWSALILYLLPTRNLIANWIRNKNMGKVILGLAIGTWIVYGLSHITLSAIYYSMFNWPEVQFYPLIPIIPFENLLRAGIGVVIGTGVIAGMRAIGLVKPEHAVY